MWSRPNYGPTDYGYPQFTRSRTDRQGLKSHHFRLQGVLSEQQFMDFLSYLDQQFPPSTLNWAARGVHRNAAYKNYTMVITMNHLSSVWEMERHLGRDLFEVNPIFGERQLQYFLERVWEISGNEVQEIRFSQGPSPEFELSEEDYSV